MKKNAKITVPALTQGEQLALRTLAAIRNHRKLTKAMPRSVTVRSEGPDDSTAVRDGLIFYDCFKHEVYLSEGGHWAFYCKLLQREAPCGV